MVQNLIVLILCQKVSEIRDCNYAIIGPRSCVLIKLKCLQPA